MTDFEGMAGTDQSPDAVARLQVAAVAWSEMGGIVGVNDTYEPLTLAHINDLMLRVQHDGPLYIQVGERVRRFYRRHFLSARKAWPRRKRFRRAVHRAHRKRAA